LVTFGSRLKNDHSAVSMISVLMIMSRVLRDMEKV
jgi:hypothetical protein